MRRAFSRSTLAGKKTCQCFQTLRPCHSWEEVEIWAGALWGVFLSRYQCSALTAMWRRLSNLIPPVLLFVLNRFDNPKLSRWGRPQDSRAGILGYLYPQLFLDRYPQIVRRRIIEKRQIAIAIYLRETLHPRRHFFPLCETGGDESGGVFCPLESANPMSESRKREYQSLMDCNTSHRSTVH